MSKIEQQLEIINAIHTWETVNDYISLLDGDIHDNNELQGICSHKQFKANLKASVEYYNKEEDSLEKKAFKKFYSKIEYFLDANLKKECVPPPIKECSPVHDYKDGNDTNQLNWGGERDSSRLRTHPMQYHPMFFRRTGSPIDTVNMYSKGVFLICNGPSFTAVDQTKLKQPGVMTFGVNNGAHVFRPNLWACVDDPSRFMSSIWEDPTITKFVPMAHLEKPIWDAQTDALSDKLVGDCPSMVGYRRNEMFNANIWLHEDTINWGNHANLGGGRSVLLSAIRICHLLGFRKVYLLGCDFNMSRTDKYWFDEQRTDTAIKNNNTAYELLNGFFASLKPKFDAEGFNVYNLNPNSRLKVFDFKDLDECVTEEVVDVSASTHGMYRKK
jgi:hypothetical protein